MPQLFALALALLLWIPAFLCEVTTTQELVILEGQSLTVPCHYEPQYANYVKYWCQGATRGFCSSLARTDAPPSANPAEDTLSIFDNPVQQLFTVTMTNLKEADSGWYACGVEIGSILNADVVTFINIKVIHGLSVVNSQVSGEEGSSVTIECVYSERYRESEKKWCRSGDWSSCRPTGSDGSYEDTSVAVSDDRTRAFTVTLKKLQMGDTGWYWCSAGQKQISVHVLVTPRPTTTPLTSPPSESVARLSPPRSITKESWSSHSHIFESLLVCASLMLLVGTAILARKLWKQHKEDPELREVKEVNVKVRINKHPGDDDCSIILLNKHSHSDHTY